MARRRLNIVLAMGLVLVTILIRTPHVVAKDCLAVLDEVHAIQKRLDQKRPSGAGQIKDYEKIQKLLAGCQGASLPSHIQTEIDTLRLAVTKRLEKLEHGKDGPTSVPVDCETRYRDCYQMYATHFELIRNLSCKEAATLINSYYNAAWKELKEKSLEKEREYPPETLQTLWRLLWRISRSDCAKSETVKTAVRKVFFPHSMEMEEILDAFKAMDPDELARLFSSLTKEDPGRFIQFICAMDHLTAGQRLDLIDKFIAVAKGMDNTQTTRFRRLLSHLPTMDQHKLERAISLLHKIPLSLDDTGRDVVDRIPEDKAAKILVHEFRLTDPQPDEDQRFAAHSLNDAFQYRSTNSAYQTISVKGKADMDTDVALFGTIAPSLEGKYQLHYRFVSQGAEEVILFQDRLTIAADEITRPGALREKAGRVYMDFLLVIAMMRLTDAAEARANIIYLKDDKPAVFIQKGVTATTRLFERGAIDEWESIREIVVDPEFWGPYPQKAAIILNTGYQETIMERLQALYYRSYHALVKEGKEHPDTLEIYGENHGPFPDTPALSDEKQSRLSIIFGINYEKKVSIDLILPQAMIENEPETVKQIIARIVCRSIAIFLNFRPEPLDLEKLAPPPEYPIAASFLFPGIWRQGTYKHAEEAPPLKLRAWNYSNLALLGVTIGAEAAYIGSDYESDGLFWTAVGGTGLFLLNGSIALIDAWIHHRDTRATAAAIRPKIELLAAQSLGSPALVLSIPF